MRTRLQGIARAAGADFDTLDIAVIDVPVLRLDHRNDRQRLHETIERIRPRLHETIERIRPRLLVLDPLVRLHRVDENAVADIAPILAFLRHLQRRFATAVVLVHHARKSGATRPGQALRGSSELHAWGDSNLFVYDDEGDRDVKPGGVLPYLNKARELGLKVRWFRSRAGHYTTQHLGWALRKPENKDFWPR